MKLHTENEIGNKSNPLEFRINGACSTVDPSTYNEPKAEYTVFTNQVEIRFWDDVRTESEIRANMFDETPTAAGATLKANVMFNAEINNGICINCD